MVAWFVSNCDSWNKRLDYAQRLAKYIQVTKESWNRDWSKCPGRHLRKVRQPNLPAWQCKLLRNARGWLQVLSGLRELQLEGLYYGEVFLQQPSPQHPANRDGAKYWGLHLCGAPQLLPTCWPVQRPRSPCKAPEDVGPGWRPVQQVLWLADQGRVDEHQVLLQTLRPLALSQGSWSRQEARGRLGKMVANWWSL